MLPKYLRVLEPDKCQARRIRQPRSIRLTHATRCSASRLVVIAIVAILNLVPFAGMVQAAAGDLDATFDADGKATTDFFGGVDTALDLAVRPDGRIVAAGAAQNGDSNADFAVAQYNEDGSLDASFGASGKVSIDFGLFEQANALALQPDGKIILAGITGDRMIQGDFALARISADGTLDTSFGSEGKVITDFLGRIDSAAGIALQPDGRIVVAGTAFSGGSSSEFAVARYNTDGSLDPSFGAGGKTTTDFFGLIDVADDVALMPDGRVVLAGQALPFGRGPAFAVARYNSDGSLDSDFGTGGKVTTDFFGTSHIVGSLAVQPDGRVIVAGAADDLATTGFDFALARYTTSGSLDASFGEGGKVTTHFVGNLDAAADVALQPEGRIVVAGTVADVSDRMGANFGLARYDNNGRLDTSFGAHGKVITDFFGGLDLAAAIAVQSNGRVLVAGAAANGIAGNDFALARYTAPVEPDFAIALEPESVSVIRGRKIKVKVRVDRVLGFDGAVTVTPQNAGALNLAVNPESISVEDSAAKVKVKAKSSAPIGTHQLVFTGRDAAGRERTTTLTLEIQ